MKPQLRLACAIALVLTAASSSGQAPVLRFDHTHTFDEVATYLKGVHAAYPEITTLHTIGKSYLGRDLLVLEITRHATGPGVEKPGLFIDGNLHSGEVIGGEICLNTIQTLVTGYRSDPLITELVDTRAFYIMPKLNPDGSDHYITRPDGMRSVVRPFDEDGDGREDEDPPEDLNGDGHITDMRIRVDGGPLKTSPEDPRLMVPAQQGSDTAGWSGEWRLYTEGVDNDEDGRFNEDGTGGIDINRNFPEQWQPSPVSFHPGPYPLSELESRAVADFLLSHSNLAGLVNYHMSGNVAVFPPSNLRTDPITGDVLRQPYEDELTFERLGGKADELIEDVEVQVFKIHGASPATWHGSIWGVYVDWVYYRLGLFAWIFEVGVHPGVADIFPSYGKEIERLRWSDQHMNGGLFVEWRPYDHPQLGPVEIGGFVDKIFDPEHRTYTNVMCLPGPGYEKQLADHTRWHLFLMSQSPLVRIHDVQVAALGGNLYRIGAFVHNAGFLPTYVTEHALQSGTARPVVVHLSLQDATLISGGQPVELGHLPAKSSPPRRVEWVVEVSGPSPTAIVRVAAPKGGTDTRKVMLR